MPPRVNSASLRVIAAAAHRYSLCVLGYMFLGRHQGRSTYERQRSPDLCDIAQKPEVVGSSYNIGEGHLLVPRAVCGSLLDPQVTHGVVLWVAIFVVDILTTKSRFTLLFDHQSPCFLSRIIATTLGRL